MSSEHSNHAAQVAELSLLLKWKGKNTALKPMLLMAHIDVVTSATPSLFLPRKTVQCITVLASCLLVIIASISGTLMSKVLLFIASLVLTATLVTRDVQTRCAPVQVPADESNASLWTHPPFGGIVSKDGFIYGRGTADIKSMLTAELEAVEQLITNGCANHSMRAAVVHQSINGPVSPEVF